MKKKPEQINKVSVLTLGCAKNVVDSEHIISDLKSVGIGYTQNIEESDAIIVNTCGFIDSAKEESVQAIIDACHLKKNGIVRRVFVTGCLSERYSEALKKQIHGVDFYFGVNSFPEIVHNLTGGKSSCQTGNPRTLLTPKHYAYIKISEGCNHECSFCAIPSIRGTHVSRRIEEIVDEVRLLADNGTKEFIIIAQDTTLYGVDIYRRRMISDLLERLSKIDNVKWLRLMYAYPLSFPEKLADVISRFPNICNYVDLPLQHISDKILRSMKRGSGSAKINKLLDMLRTKIPDLAIRTTFITGYPGETEEDFSRLLGFINEQKFARLGVFTYSHEDGTTAYKLKDTIPAKIKEERRNLLMAAQGEISLKKNKELIGKNLNVLLDEVRNGLYYGRTQWDAPDVDNVVIIESKRNLHSGQFVEITPNCADYYDLYANL
ncbi:MAG: 2-methylthioadenine synthetase [Ignavibacteria bacterium]|nr:2-methylthioadenine synthetase [Ignavibacteria bacterium]